MFTSVSARMWAFVSADRDATTHSRTGSSRERLAAIKTKYYENYYDIILDYFDKFKFL
jgi:hypothetical protein